MSHCLSNLDKLEAGSQIIQAERGGGGGSRLACIGRTTVGALLIFCLESFNFFFLLFLPVRLVGSYRLPSCREDPARWGTRSICPRRWGNCILVAVFKKIKILRKNKSCAVMGILFLHLGSATVPSLWRRACLGYVAIVVNLEGFGCRHRRKNEITRACTQSFVFLLGVLAILCYIK